jgi:hypothetical protein
MVKWKSCYLCGGTKKMPSGRKDEDGNPIMVTCSACHGTGKVVDTE